MSTDTEQTQETQTPTEAEIMSGGLPDMTVPSETTQETVQTQEQTQEPALPPRRYVVGTREFATADEALAYANGIAAVQAPSVAAQQVQQTQAPQEKRLAEILFEDPDKALGMVKDQAIAEFKQEQRRVEQDKKLWDDFYSRHPDLKGREILVDAVLMREQRAGTFNGFSLDQQAQILATRTRDEVRKISGAASSGQALPSKPAMVASSSGAPAPKVQTPKPQPTDFVTELRRMRQRS